MQRLLRWADWDIEGSAMTCGPARHLRLILLDHCYS